MEGGEGQEGRGGIGGSGRGWVGQEGWRCKRKGLEGQEEMRGAEGRDWEEEGVSSTSSLSWEVQEGRGRRDGVKGAGGKRREGGEGQVGEAE